jgi:hypothetical protein
MHLQSRSIWRRKYYGGMGCWVSAGISTLLNYRV